MFAEKVAFDFVRCFFHFQKKQLLMLCCIFSFAQFSFKADQCQFFSQNCCRIWLSFADLLRLLYLVYSLVCIYSQICFALLFLFAKEDINSNSVEFRLQKFLHVFVFNEYICALRFIQIFSEIVVFVLFLLQLLVFV